MQEQNSKTVALVALVISVLGLSIGFAAFSSTLTIKSEATVTPTSENFKVLFGAGSVSPSDKGSVTLSSGAEGTNTIAAITAQLSKPGDSVTMTIPVLNQGAYDAYLRTVTFTPATTKCTAVVTEGKTSVSSDLMDAACDKITMTVKVGPAAESLQTFTTTTELNKVQAEAQKLGKTDGAGQAVITISYASDAVDVDGDVKVDFGSVELKYTSDTPAN